MCLMSMSEPTPAPTPRWAPPPGVEGEATKGWNALLNRQGDEVRLFRHDHVENTENRLVPVVASLSPKGRRAMYAVANSGVLRRGAWKGCPLNRAALELGQPVNNTAAAASLFDTSAGAIRRFVRVWDKLPGSGEECTQLLREALEAAGLFGEQDQGAHVKLTDKSLILRQTDHCPEPVG